MAFKKSSTVLVIQPAAVALGHLEPGLARASFSPWQGGKNLKPRESYGAKVFEVCWLSCIVFLWNRLCKQSHRNKFETNIIYNVGVCGVFSFRPKPCAFARCTSSVSFLSLPLQQSVASFCGFYGLKTTLHTHVRPAPQLLHMLWSLPKTFTVNIFEF